MTEDYRLSASPGHILSRYPSCFFAYLPAGSLDLGDVARRRPERKEAIQRLY